jgi:hypothetical protein
MNANLLMLRLMQSGNSDRIRELKLTAKWSANSNEKKKAILQLTRYGDEARPAIEEVLGITAYDDVKQACLNAIRSLGREQEYGTLYKNKISKTKRAPKVKKQNKKKKRAK